MGGRALKKVIFGILSSDDFESSLGDLLKYSPKKTINPLFSFFYSTQELIKWRAISATGLVTSELAHQDMESARVVMRRLMWNLNDESGGIGWGAPEAMGEIMACHEGLAAEYNHILASYIMANGNFIEYEALQRGVIWGIGRLAHARPGLLKRCAGDLLPFLASSDPWLRGLAAWASGPINSPQLIPSLKTLLKDETTITVYIDRKLASRTIEDLARQALEFSET